MATDIKKILLEQNLLFEELASYIPPQLYNPPATLQDPAFANGKALKRKKNAVDKELIKQAKRQKFMPRPIDISSAVTPATPATPADDVTAPPSETQTTSQPSREELRAKLHAKIEALQQERKANKPSTSKGGDNDKPSTPQPQGREALLAESRQVQDVIVNDKQKQKQKNRRGGSKKEDIETTSLQVVKPAQTAVETEKETAVAVRAQERDEHDLGFSNLDFTASDALQAVDMLPSANKRTRRKQSNKDPEVALKRLEDRKFFLEKLTPQARERAEEKDRWEAMNKKATGEKVLDDETKLKKMVKRQEKKKEKSRLAWKDRQETESDKQAKRQAKRTENIQARNQAKKDKGKKGVKSKSASSSKGPHKAKKMSQRGFEKSKPPAGAGKHRSSTAEGARKRL